jgi:hypothetical protein
MTSLTGVKSIAIMTRSFRVLSRLAARSESLSDAFEELCQTVPLPVLECSGGGGVSRVVAGSGDGGELVNEVGVGGPAFRDPGPGQIP